MKLQVHLGSIRRDEQQPFHRRHYREHHFPHHEERNHQPTKAPPSRSQLRRRQRRAQARAVAQLTAEQVNPPPQTEQVISPHQNEQFIPPTQADQVITPPQNEQVLLHSPAQHERPELPPCDHRTAPQVVRPQQQCEAARDNHLYPPRREYCPMHDENILVCEPPPSTPAWPGHYLPQDHLHSLPMVGGAVAACNDDVSLHTDSVVTGIMRGGGSGGIQPWQALNQQPGYHPQQVEAYPHHLSTPQEPFQASQLAIDVPLHLPPGLPPMAGQHALPSGKASPSVGAAADPIFAQTGGLATGMHQMARTMAGGSVAASDTPPQQLQLNWVLGSESAKKKKRGGRRKRNNESYDNSAVNLNASYREIERQLNEPLELT